MWKIAMNIGKYWYYHCEYVYHNQDNCHADINAVTQQDTAQNPIFIKDIHSDTLKSIRYVYANWLSTKEQALTRRYVEHTLAPSKPIIEHIYDLCNESKVSLNELVSLTSGIRAYQNDVCCQCCGVAQMVYPKVAEFKTVGFKDLSFEKAPYHICAECNLFREVPF